MASSQNGLTLPASQPSPGMVPPLVFTGKPAKAAIILVAVGVVTATAFVWGRIYTKIRLIKSHGWEDYTSIIAWIFLMVLSAFYIKSSECGSGIHQWNLPDERFEDWAHWTNRTEIVYVPTMLITKVSILLMYLRLFMPNRQTKICHFTRFIIWTNVLFYLSVLIVSINGCIPRRKIWQIWVPGKCVDEEAILLVTAVINTLSDLIILLLPIGCIWHLQLSPRRKLAISAVFATGSVACVASVVRVTIATKSYRSKDFTYAIGSQTDWAYGEVVVGIICGCLPVVPQFFRHLVPKVTQKLSHYRSKAQEYIGRLMFPSQTASFTAPPGDSERDLEVLCDNKKGKSFPALESSSMSLSTMNRNVLPSALPLTSLFHAKKWTSDDSVDLESQRGITKIKDEDNSISNQTEFEEMDIANIREHEAP